MKRNTFGLGMMLGACALVLALALSASAGVMTLQAEDYLAGSNALYNTTEGLDSAGYTYYDLSAGNSGGFYGRTNDSEDIDIYLQSGEPVVRIEYLADPARREWFYLSGDTSSPWNTNPTFDTTAFYRITIRAATASANRQCRISVGGTEVALITPNQTSGLLDFTTTVVTSSVPISAGQQTVKFEDTSWGSYAVDWISFEAIPEPETISLLGVSAAGILLLRRIRM